MGRLQRFCCVEAAGTCGYHCDIMVSNLQLRNDTEVCLCWGKGEVYAVLWLRELGAFGAWNYGP